jgi:hypothetical protein
VPLAEDLRNVESADVGSNDVDDPMEAQPGASSADRGSDPSEPTDLPVHHGQSGGSHPVASVGEEAVDEIVPRRPPIPLPPSRVDGVVAETRQPSVWDEMRRSADHEPESRRAAPAFDRPAPAIDAGVVGAGPEGGSTLHRLLELRSGIESLRSGSVEALRDALDRLERPWARRRALVALIEAGVPADPDAALDLIQELGRQMDRRWCLTALARRGDLEGAALERALGLLASGASRRRIIRLAGP